MLSKQNNRNKTANNSVSFKHESFINKYQKRNQSQQQS